MVYGSWDMKHDGQNFLFFSTDFCPFTPLRTQKIKTLKNWKKCLEIWSFYNTVPKIMIICYFVPEIWCVTDVIVIFHFRPFFALLQKIKVKKKNEKMPGDIIILHMWNGVKGRMDEGKDRKSDILRWVPHLKMIHS